MANFALAVTRFGFRALQALSPDLAGEAAFGSFANNGTVRVEGTLVEGTRSIALQTDGKMVVAAWSAPKTPAGKVGIDQATSVTLIRLNRGGTLDTTFGDRGSQLRLGVRGEVLEWSSRAPLLPHEQHRGVRRGDHEPEQFIAIGSMAQQRPATSQRLVIGVGRDCQHSHRVSPFRSGSLTSG